MMDTVLTFLAANRQRLELAHYGVPERLSSLVITPRFRASSHVVFLIVAPGSPGPLLVAKLPRLGGASASVEREVANLRAVQAGRAGGFESIPRVVAFEEYLGRSILVETALVGQPMDPATVRRDRAGCCDALTEWLAALPQPSGRADSGEGNWFGRLVEAPLRHFQNVFPLSAEEERLLDRTWELIAPLRDAALPLVFEHGDLSHPNIMLLRDGSPGVVDWELAEPRGLPTYDLFFFLTYAAFASQNAHTGGGYLAAFHAAFFGRSAWARPYADAYARRLALPPHTLTPLFVLSWARYIASLLLRLDAERTGGRVTSATATWLRANRYYALWRHAVMNASALDWADKPASRSRSS
jgi:aminoglycoside phosphotransferase